MGSPIFALLIVGQIIQPSIAASNRLVGRIVPSAIQRLASESQSDLVVLAGACRGVRVVEDGARQFDGGILAHDRAADPRPARRLQDGSRDYPMFVLVLKHVD
ncbi:MAG: hypothetical protein KGJ57_12590 [Sphingomonadales bacterium]|nr:hypothetical protein [Sphingomonadales bacterium]MDE2170251.1 hypothetical protein [Sphingomonadales bacterium]